MSRPRRRREKGTKRQPCVWSLDVVSKPSAAAATTPANARAFHGGGFGLDARFAAVAGLAAGVATASAAYEFYTHTAGVEGQGGHGLDAASGDIYTSGPLGY